MLTKTQMLEMLTSKGRTKNRRRPISREEAIAAAFVSGCQPGSFCFCQGGRTRKKPSKKPPQKKHLIDAPNEVQYSPVL